METLLAYRDGALPPGQAAKAAKHVDQCPRCCAHLDQIEIEVWRLQAAVERPVGAQQVAERLEKLTQRMHCWDLAQREPGGPVPEQITSQVRVFFGSCAAASVGRTIGAQPDARSALSAAEPLFTAFLGERAAFLLASRVLEGREPPA